MGGKPNDGFRQSGRSAGLLSDARWNLSKSTLVSRSCARDFARLIQSDLRDAVFA